MPIFDKNKSKIKLWVASGTGKPHVHYSVLSQDKKSPDEIIAKMTVRILEKHHKSNFRLAVFYENSTGKEIKRISGNTVQQKNKIDRQTAKIKLWIGFPDDSKNATWFNLDAYNHLPNTEIIKQMTERILRGMYRYDFTKAIFYNNISGLPLAEVSGELIKNK
jgi:hypothetical protein